MKFSMRLVYAYIYIFRKKYRLKSSNYRIFRFGRKFEVDLRMTNKFNRIKLDVQTTSYAKNTQRHTLIKLIPLYNMCTIVNSNIHCEYSGLKDTTI